MSQHITPLRYPGGKQRIAPFVSEVMILNGLEGAHYAEPYAGGAGVALELLVQGTASHIHLNDKCRSVFSFWKSVTTQTDAFCKRIARVALTVDEWKRQREILRDLENHDDMDVGFATFFLNRCNRSGIATGGVIGGLAQTGAWKIDARFSREELTRRVEIVGSLSTSITVRNLDAEAFMTKYLSKVKSPTFVYCDPPYFNKADRLYLNHYSPEDHGRIAATIQKKLVHPWIVSYDSAPQIASLYAERRSFTYSLQYSAAESYKGTELFIFEDGLEIPSTSAVEAIRKSISRNSKKLQAPKATRKAPRSTAT